MNDIVKFILRCIFTPFGVVMIGGTALIEYMSREPDWEYWKSYNAPIFGMLPFHGDKNGKG